MPLSRQESEILGTLLKQRGKTVTREVLFYRIWGNLPDKPSRVVDVHVSSLNRKIRKLMPGGEGTADIPDGTTDRLIVTVRGLGYKIL